MALSKQNDAAFFVRVTEVLEGRGDVRIFELRAPDGGELPPFSAGAHIDLHAKPDLVRQYSLLNDPQECHRYVIAIALEPESRGGSRYFHEEVAAGDLLRISTPRCHFRLKEDAPYSILIA